MKKITFSLVAVAISWGALVAQSVEQGKKFLYYQRYKSAKDQFEKVLAANPNNLEAVYWLGQTLLNRGETIVNEEKNPAAAKELYQKTLMSNGTAPLVLVGMGHIELLDGKVNDARQRFETAISLTKGKDIGVMNAIGIANVDAKDGDANYAIEKLNVATQIKGFRDPNTYLIMGDAYRKLIDGGAAVTAYQKALAIDPKLAAAKYKIGKIYLTQNNKEYFLRDFEEAVQLDPNYGPAYYELFYYWYWHGDVDKAAMYFDKYLAVADVKPSNDYDRISIFYARKKYADAISASQAKIKAEGDKADPRYYKLIAYSYFDQGDSVNAKNWMEQYSTKQKPDGYVPMDYSFMAELLAKFPGNEDKALKTYQLAIVADTSYDGKLDLMTKAAALARKVGNRMEEANFLKQLYLLKKVPSNTDLYNLGQAYYQAKQYGVSDSIFCNVYQQKYPTEIFGYLWCARSKEAQDTTWSSGIALQPYEKLATMAMSLDSTKYKRQAIEAWFKLAVYYNDIKKDKQAAIAQLDKILAADPANTDALHIKEILSRPPPKQPARQPAAKQKTGGTKGSPPGR